MTACQNKKAESVVAAPEAAADIVVEEVALPPLVAEDVFLKDQDPFGGVIELKGEHIVSDSFIFKPREAQMFIRGDRLIMKNLSISQPNDMFLIFQYPSLRFLESVGKRGNGANEFIYPFLVPTTDTTLLAYVFESAREKLFKLDKKGIVSPNHFHFTTKKSGSLWSSKHDMVNIGPDDFIYVDDSKTGKSIFRACWENDSLMIKELFSLQLNPKRKSPFTYIGDFGVNLQKKRMVYAYKYFKILKFIDMENGKVRTLNFQQGGFDDGTLSIVNGLDQNVTYYWGMCVQKDYVYCLYSGRTPMEVGRDFNKGNIYIHVEQFDWNGNPVRKYKLDRWGYFTVDEKGKQIVLLSTQDDDPFFVFQLP